VAIGQTINQLWWLIGFQEDGCPPSWICYTDVWTTHEGYLVVFIVKPNSVGICNMSVLVLCKFGFKMPLFQGFCGFDQTP